MKECPVCKAVCFDDMAICFGCLHRFDESDEKEQLPSEKMSEALAASRSLQLPEDEDKRALSRLDALESESHETNPENLPEVQGLHAKARHAAIAPAHPARSLGEKVPSPLDVPIDAVVIPNEQCNQDEWILRVAIPSGCEGVTVRLERP